MNRSYMRGTLLVERTILKHLGVLILTSLALCGLAILSGCSQSSQPNQAQTQNQGQTTTSIQTVNMDASWTRLYHDVKSLKQDADIVVRGSITKVAGITQPQKGPVMTDFTFTISHVVWDPHQQVKGTSIIIHQTGGVVGNIRYQISDDPLFQVGEQAVLFLHQYSPGHYYVIGGPSGRFTVQGGTVRSINDEGVKLASPTSENAFYSMVQQA